VGHRLSRDGAVLERREGRCADFVGAPRSVRLWRGDYQTELNVVETLVDEGFAQLPSDFALHQALVDNVGSPRMSRIYAGTAEEIRLALAQLRRAYTSPSEISAEHRTPVEAICSNDRERALEVARGHLDASERILVDQHDPSERRTAHGR
jgi:DNA-binding FadR family transcriptional regulator